VHHLRHKISLNGHRILLLVMTNKDRGLSFNDLRRPPYCMNPKTLARQLRQLRTWRLITRHARTVRGGKQYRYTLTPRGGRFLSHPIPLDNLDRTLFDTLTEILGYDSKTENQLLGIDLATAREIKYRMELSARLTWQNSACEVILHWEKRGQRPIHPDLVKISKNRTGRYRGDSGKMLLYREGPICWRQP
jgi:DNA-binding HxlR family transcriptional regulator